MLKAEPKPGQVMQGRRTGGAQWVQMSPKQQGVPASLAPGAPFVVTGGGGGITMSPIPASSLRFAA